MTASPRRTCVGCRRSAPRGEFRRISSAPDGSLRVGVAEPGRGVWVCSAECFDAAVRRRVLARALRRRLTAAEIEGVRARLFA